MNTFLKLLPVLLVLGCSSPKQKCQATCSRIADQQHAAGRDGPGAKYVGTALSDRCEALCLKNKWNTTTHKCMQQASTFDQSEDCMMTATPGSD